MQSFHFHRPRFWTRNLVAMLVALGLGTFLGGASLVFAEGAAGLLGAAVLTGAYAVGVALVLGLRVLLLPRHRPTVEVHEDHLMLPGSVSSRWRYRVPYADLRAVELRFRPPAQLLIIDTTRRTFVYSTSRFEDPESVVAFREALRERIGALPDGAEILSAIASQADRARAALARRPTATHVISLLLVGFFFVELAMGATDNLLRLIPLGANNRVLVESGELHRLIAANVLHGGWVHLILNLLGILTFGGLVERLIGPWRYLIVYLLAGIGGAVGSAFYSNAMFSVGASGCLFGLLGGYAVVTLRHRNRLPGGFRLHWRWWTFILVVNGLLPVLFPMIDWVAHLAGFLVGGLAAVAVALPEDSVEPTAPTPGWVRATALALATLWAAGLAATAQNARSGSGTAVRMLAERTLADPESDPEALNFVAWFIGIDPAAERASLLLARDVAERALADSRSQPHIQDTLAQVLHRLGETERAVSLELEVFEGGEEPRIVYATQLARFLRASLLAEASPVDSELTVELAPGEKKTRQVRVSGPQQASGVLLYALVFETSRLTGLLRVCLAPDGASERLLPVTEEARGAWPDSPRLVLAREQPGPCTAADGSSAALWPLEAEHAALP